MNNTEVLVLNGSPGAGKSTIADAIGNILRNANVAHAIIDVDYLARVYPETNMRTVQWQNLAAIWPNYTNVENVKIIIPVLIDTPNDLQALKDATPCKNFTICELVANTKTLVQRVTAREKGEYWQNKLRDLVINYEKRDSSKKFADIKVSTQDKPIQETAIYIVNKLGWLI